MDALQTVEKSGQASTKGKRKRKTSTLKAAAPNITPAEVVLPVEAKVFDARKRIMNARLKSRRPRPNLGPSETLAPVVDLDSYRAAVLNDKVLSGVF